MDATDQTDPSGSFQPARDRLAAAAAARTQLLDAWNSLGVYDAFNLRVQIEGDGYGCVYARADLSIAGAALQTHARAFIQSITAAMNTAIYATASINCPGMSIDSDLHRMPLLSDPAEFDARVLADLLPGLRPDQVTVVRSFQPFQGGTQGRDVVGRLMSHLVACRQLITSGVALVTAWASSADPVFEPLSGVTLGPIEVEAAGIAVPEKKLLTFHAAPPELARLVRVNPQVPFDPIFAAEPWPSDMDDNLDKRTRVLLVLAERLIDGLENSVSAPTFLQRFGSLDALNPAGKERVWLPVVFDDPADEQYARAALGASDLNIASYRNDDGVLILLRRDDAAVVGREIPQATPPVESMDFGIGIEQAALEAAADWGLPDFIFMPEMTTKGAATREIGDGTIVTANRGLALQVKARENITENPDREASWLCKKAVDGLRQARGTIRTALAKPDVKLTNLRGRQVAFDGETIAWVPVIILDHAEVPDEVLVEAETGKRGMIVTRRDWEFLWNQLRSTAAVVDYVHRVADEDPIPIGTETNRYFDLADKDAAAKPEPPEERIAMTGAMQLDGPTLPTEPAHASDTSAHAVFRQILDDIAETDFTGEELVRLETLAKIDRYAVTYRAELGRTLLRRIDDCALAPAGTFKAQHRIAILDNGNVHLAFSVYSLLTGYHREFYKTWLQVRRQQYLESSGRNPEEVWSVGVLITPRPDGTRMWDTTVIATNAPSVYDAVELERLIRLNESDLPTPIVH
ncbi:hypothetical protein [Flexivirga sp.]|uniref:hypothetical protein n=1 Tax=Flexivirga sp. TaxID=1962927 RepID=UPI003F814783